MSAGSVAAFATILGLEPGTARQDRRRRIREIYADRANAGIHRDRARRHHRAGRRRHRQRRQRDAARRRRRRRRDPPRRRPGDPGRVPRCSAAARRAMRRRRRRAGCRRAMSSTRSARSGAAATRGEPALLASCHRRSLEVAAALGCRTRRVPRDLDRASTAIRSSSPRRSRSRRRGPRSQELREIERVRFVLFGEAAEAVFAEALELRPLDRLDDRPHVVGRRAATAADDARAGLRRSRARPRRAARASRRRPTSRPSCAAGRRSA